MSVADFTASTSAVEVSVSERGRRRFELNPSSLWEGVQSATLDFVDNKLATVIVVSSIETGWTDFVSKAIAKRGTPQGWPATSGTSLFERKIVEESAVWLTADAAFAYLREGSSSGSRYVAVLMSRSRFDALKAADQFGGSARQMITLNALSLILTQVDVTYARAINPQFAWLAGADLDWSPSDSVPFLGLRAGLQWYPVSGGSPKGFFVEASGRLAVANTGSYVGLYGKLGYNFIFNNGFVLGLSGGASVAPGRESLVSPSFSLDLGWAP
jgi:hypothetical protein